MPVFAIPFPVIDPVALQLGPLSIKWYGLAYVAGLLGGWWYARRLAAAEALWGGRARPSADSLDDFLLFAALGVVIGGRLGFVLFYNLPEYLANPLEIFAVWKGGMSFHGGLMGAAAGLWVFARRRGYPPLSALDLGAAVAPIGLFLGRIANFVNGELWGRHGDPDACLGQSMFPHGGPLPRHPSQLYEAGLEGIVLFTALAIMIRLGALKRPGLILGSFITIYGIARIIGEHFREPDPQLGFLFGTSWLTMGMVLSLPLFLAGLFLVLRRKGPAAA
jgi:phosphatidylglycerol:prolipoprotein diacylglycerol transferase